MTYSNAVPFSRLINSPQFRHLMAWLMVVAGIAVGFSEVDLGNVGTGDEAYQAICVRDYRNSPLGMLAYFIGNMWQDIFGDTVLALRCLASVMILGAIGSACWYLYRRTGEILLSTSVFLVCVTVARISEFNFYNWDTGSYLFDAVALVSVVSFIYRPALWKALLAGASLACMAMARVPLAVLFPVSLLIVALACRNHNCRLGRGCALTAAMAAVYILTIILLVTLMCGSPTEYIRSFRAENIVSGHSLSDMDEWVDRIRRLGFRQLLWWIPATGTVLLSLFVYRAYSCNKWLCISMTVLLMAFSVVIMRHCCAWKMFEWPMLGCALPLFVGVLLMCTVWNRTHPGSEKINVSSLALWTCVVFVALFAFGSDTFFERMCSVFAIPVVLGIVWKPLGDGGGRRFVWTFLLLSFLTMGSMLGSHSLFKSKIHTEDAGNHFPQLAGLEVEPGCLQPLYDAEDAVRTCREAGFRYVVMGERYNVNFAFGRDNGVSVHNFHLNDSDASKWSTALKDSLMRADAVIYVAHPSVTHKVDNTALKNMGFMELEKYECFFLMAKGGAVRALGSDRNE